MPFRSICLLLLSFLSYSTALSQATQPSNLFNVENILIKSGPNRTELEKVITYCKKSKDSLKLKAAYFLIGNMDSHSSSDYYWKDSVGNQVAFSEFDYPDFPAAINAMSEIKKVRGPLYMKDTIKDDIKTIKAEYLINNIENAFKTWRTSIARDIPFNDFCEYILPYRVTVEPLQDWRTAYNAKYQWITDSLKNKPMEKILLYAKIDYENWFSFTWGKEDRNEPLPALGAQQLLFRKKGMCEDVASLQVFALRSQGLPASYDIVPLWGTSIGSHFLNTVFDSKMKPVRFDVTAPVVANVVLPREPAKVIRLTYSKQPTLATIEKSENIPSGFLQSVNYIDVTNEYWKTADIQFDLPDSKDSNIVYACMFSGGSWRPIWWGKPLNNKVTFSNMPKGTVILPAYYNNGKLRIAGLPKAHGYNNELLLKPDLSNTREIIIQEQEKFLIFRPGKSYRLYYWDGKWKMLGEKKADNSKKLVFENVPKNALLILIPEYSEKKERPFIMVDNIRYWW